MQVGFGGCLFKYSELDKTLLLHTRNLDGVDQTHIFPLSGAFLVNIGSGFWRFVTGAEHDTEARYLFDDAGMKVQERVDALNDLGVLILNSEEGKQNLVLYQLPVKRLMISS